MAKEKDMNIVEFNRYAERNLLIDQIDREIDKRQREAISEKKDCIVDSRLGGYLLTSDLRIWLTAPITVRAERLAKRDGCDEKEALKRIEQRESSERARYKAIYDVDINDPTIYDLILNTEKFIPDQMTDIASKAVDALKK